MIRVQPRANQTNPVVTTTSTTQFDNAIRMISISYNDGTPAKTYAYDQSAATTGGGASLGYSKWYLTSYATGGTQGFYGYDPMGRVKLVSSCQPVNCSGSSYSNQNYTYDAIGNLLSAGDGAGRTTAYSYTVASEPATASNVPSAGDVTPLVTSVQYGAFGPKSMSLGNGLATVNGYDIQGRPNARWVCSGSTSANCLGGSTTYGMSATWSGQRLTNTWYTVLNQTQSFGYDDFNRLKSRVVTAGAQQDFTDNYDRWGSRTQQTAYQSGPAVSTMFSTANNQF